MKKITRITGLKGTLRVPGDKSISHRAIMFGSLAEGTTTIHGFLKGADCLSTIDCFRKMGISIEEKEDTIYVYGKGLHGLHKPEETLDVGNSGTTTRLISGILAGQNFDTVLSLSLIHISAFHYTPERESYYADQQCMSQPAYYYPYFSAQKEGLHP